MVVWEETLEGKSLDQDENTEDDSVMRQGDKPVP